jgi:chitinase
VTCQGLGKTILLSIGGATYSEGGFSSTDAAVAGAQLVWETFGPVSSDSTVNRPFGDAVVDGFDFDFESTVENMPAFANELRTLFAQDTSKTYYLTAAPQCPYPDAADSPMLDGSVYFDAIWVQFYNNYCGVNTFVASSTTQDDFNFETWNTWATTVSLNPDVKVFIGIPGDTTAAGTGYVSASAIASIVDYIKDQEYTSFGGVMLWDASQVYAHDGFLSDIASALRSSSSSSTSSTKTAASTTKTTAVSTTTHAATTTSTSNVQQTTSHTTTTTTKASTTLITLTKTTSSKTEPTTKTDHPITADIKKVLATSSSTTSTSTTTTTSLTSALTSSSTCPVMGESCSASGTYQCNGSSFGLCDNNKWAIQKCASGLVCVQDGSSIYCDFKKDHPDTTCS